MEPTRDGEHFIKAWLGACESEKLAKGELNRAECNTHNTRSDLAKWMVPGDAKPGEKIAIWYGDSLIQVEVAHPGKDHSVTIRTRGRALHAA
jgi:hypothetical protein